MKRNRSRPNPKSYLKKCIDSINYLQTLTRCLVIYHVFNIPNLRSREFIVNLIWILSEYNIQFRISSCSPKTSWSNTAQLWKTVYQLTSFKCSNNKCSKRSNPFTVTLHKLSLTCQLKTTKICFYNIKSYNNEQIWPNHAYNIIIKIVKYKVPKHKINSLKVIIYLITINKCNLYREKSWSKKICEADLIYLLLIRCNNWALLNRWEVMIVILEINIHIRPRHQKSNK